MQELEQELKKDEYEQNNLTNSHDYLETIENLTRIKNKHNFLLSNILDVILELDEKGTITYVNDQVEKLFGFKPIEVLGRKILRFVHPNDLNYTLKRIQKSFISNEDFEIEYRSIHKNGQYSPVYVKGIIRCVEKKRNLFLLIRDLSKRKEIENKFIESEERCREMFENSPNAIILINIKGDIIDCNSATKKLSGFTKNDLVGKNVLKISTIPNEFIPIVLKGLETLRNGGIPEPQEIQLYTKEGKKAWIYYQISLIKSYDENLIQLTIQDLRSLKKAREKLEDYEKNFQVLFNNSTSGIAYHKVVYDALGNPINYLITDVNPQYEKILNIKREEVINRTATEAYNVEKAPYLEVYSNVANTQESVTFEAYFQPISKYFKISVISPRKGEFITVFDDISERKNSVLKLKESEEKYRYLFENSPFAVALMDLNGKFLECNSYVKKVFGFEKEEIIGKNFIDINLVPQESLPMVFNGFRQINNGKTPVPKEIQLFKKDGSIIWVLLHVSLVRLRNINLVQVIVEDITERKLNDKKLIESEEKFRIITEQSFIGIAILQDFTFKYINKQFSDTLGYSSDEILRWKPREFFQIIPPKDREMVQLIAEEKYYGTEGVLANLQFRVVKKTGDIIWLEIVSKTITFKGKPADLVATLDISEKIEAERLILEENKKLLKLNKMRKDLITRVSHELKTPLTSMYGASQILLKHLIHKIDDEVISFIEIFHRGALRLKKLVENLIDASRIETGKLELRLSNENIVEIVEECVEEMKYLTTNRNQTINLELLEEIYLNVDKIRLQQVITNILSNAIKNTPKNGSIYVNLLENQEYIDIKIKDTGIGITKEEKGLLFEKFGKMERYGMDLGVDIEGSGLGLYISKEIIDLHGGQIIVESEGRHKGALFIVRLFKN